MERLKQPLREVVHIGRCIIELGGLAVREVLDRVDQAIDCFGPDDEIDAAIPSHIRDQEKAS